MAPEQLAGREVSERSDIFSLGLVLFEIYTGKRAFDATTIAELLRQHDEGVHVSRRARARARSRRRARDPALPLARPGAAAGERDRGVGGAARRRSAGRGARRRRDAVAGDGRRGRPHRAGAAARSAWRWWRSSSSASARWSPCAATAFHRFVPMELSGPVLEDRARQAVQKLRLSRGAGRQLRPVRSSSGDYSRGPRRRGRRHAGSSWPAGATPAVGYWYRTSPRPLRADRDRQAGRRSTIRRCASVGMTWADVDARGCLLEFHGVPPQRAPAPAATAARRSTGRWCSTRSGWPRDRFTPATPEWTPPLATDTRAAWTGTVPELGRQPLRLEAGAFAGTVMFVQAIGPWTTPSRVPPPAVERSRSALLDTFSRARAVLIVGSALLARRKVAARPRRRARRLARRPRGRHPEVLRWARGAHHCGDYATRPGRASSTPAPTRCSPPASPGSPTSASSRGSGGTGRRACISWSRLLGGSFRDPLVGRDVLIGVAFGVAGAIYRGR